jgi:hypothetical protein
MQKKCIIITTINNPSEQVIHYSNIPGWKLIIIGDSKTDDSKYKFISCVYLGLKEQQKLYPTLYDKIPFNSYTRKMFGYIYAIKNNYDIIYDTDDDNKYMFDLDNFDKKRSKKISINEGFTNIYKVFTDKYIWPRGIPPNHKSINDTPIISNDLKNLKYSIIQGLVNNDPDVDAFYRINISNTPFFFEKDPNFDVLLDKNSVCPFNSQNTFWIDPEIFYTMYLPTTVTFRYTDILRSLISLFQLWKVDKTIVFTVPTAYQIRNEHNLDDDFESEKPMYESVEKVISLLKNNHDATLKEVYIILYENGIVKPEELIVIDEWLNLIG